MNSILIFAIQTKPYRFCSSAIFEMRGKKKFWAKMLGILHVNIKYNLFDSLSHVIQRIHFIWLFINMEFCFNIFLFFTIPEQAIHWCQKTVGHRQQTPIDTLEKEHHSYHSSTFDVILYIVESNSLTSIWYIVLSIYLSLKQYSFDIIDEKRLSAL